MTFQNEGKRQVSRGWITTSSLHEKFGNEIIYPIDPKSANSRLIEKPSQFFINYKLPPAAAKHTPN